jgi:hypothetical protein
MLCDQIGQAVGVPDLRQLSPDGLVRENYMALLTHQNIKQRVAAAGFELTSDT